MKRSGSKRRATAWAGATATALAALALGARAWVRRLSPHGRSRADDALEVRVAQRLARVSPRVDAVDVLASAGRVELVGRVRGDDLRAVLDAAARVRGVRIVDNHLEPQDDVPGSVRRHSLVAAASVTVAAPPAEVFALWNRLERLPSLLRHMREVRRVAGDRYLFRATAPGGAALEWEGTVSRYIPGALIAWRSLPGGDLTHAGIARLTRTSRGGTLLAVRLFYGASDEEDSRTLATLMGPVPDHDLGADLRRWKALLEAGKIVPDAPPGLPPPVVLPVTGALAMTIPPPVLGRR